MPANSAKAKDCSEKDCSAAARVETKARYLDLRCRFASAARVQRRHRHERSELHDPVELDHSAHSE